VIVVDLFAGAGGASTGLASIGLDPVGFEWNRDAARTHHAAGHRTVVADLAVYPWAHMRGRVRLMHGSPPCQPFSAAGDGVGEDDPRDGMPWLLRAVDEARPELVTVENVPGLLARRHRRYFAAFITRLAMLDYAVEYRVLNAADYGVPQVRRRLIIVARLDGHVRWPRRTHTEDGARGLPPWVSMAAALGWAETVEVEPVQRGAGMVARHGERRRVPATEPAPVVTGGDARGNRWRVLNTGRDWKAGGDRSTAQTRSLDEPSPAVSAVAGQWQLRAGPQERATVRVLADPSPTITAAHDGSGWVYERRAEDVIRVPLEDLAALQGFPPDYPFGGTRTAIARQIGNALPPALIAAVVRVNL
jgi:DNA (cytosine-5)-methyltransferase 1